MMASEKTPIRLEEVIGSLLAQNSGDRCFWWDGAWYSKSDFSRLTDKIERSLREFGFTRGQRITVLMTNCPAFPALSLAAWRIGGTVVPLNTKPGVESLIATHELIEPFAAVMSETVWRELGTPLHKKNFGSLICSPTGDITAPEGPKEIFKKSSIETPDTAVIFTTSGTTGLPKAVPLSHGNIHNNCAEIREAIIPLEPGDVFLNIMPNFHTIGYTIANITPLTMDAAQAIVPAFMPPSQCIKAMVDAGVNIMFVVPTIISYLVSAIERGDAPKNLLSRFKMIITGGDRLSDYLHDLSIRIAGIDVVEGYGLTETSPAISLNRDYASHRRGTVGQFLRGYEWRLTTESGGPAQGNEGVLWVKGPSVAEGYFRSPEITAARFVDGWFNTGDYVKVEDGYLTILDRVTDIIIVGGFNVYPQEVELALCGHPGVRTAIVVGIKNNMSGQVPKAYVLKEDGAGVTQRELIDYCKERLAHFKVPRKIEFVNEFPLSPTGKILRRILRENDQG
ncbi:MAG: AMP-binding protein [Synergistaceae bacterium]|jgi:long-chain acyl-CoA synthetase|nr:AMP-binding protein [Synergistaceae bacterium]